MQWIAPLALLGLLVLGGGSGLAQPLPRQPGAAAANVTNLSAQSGPRQARPRLRVTPRYPYRSYHSPYPLLYTYEYPGPKAVRQCVDWYATEHRPSGTVIVPKMRCWWVPG